MEGIPEKIKNVCQKFLRIFLNIVLIVINLSKMGLLLKIDQVVWRSYEFLCGKVFFLDSPYVFLRNTVHENYQLLIHR